MFDTRILSVFHSSFTSLASPRPETEFPIRAVRLLSVVAVWFGTQPLKAENDKRLRTATSNTFFLIRSADSAPCAVRALRCWWGGLPARPPSWARPALAGGGGPGCRGNQNPSQSVGLRFHPSSSSICRCRTERELYPGGQPNELTSIVQCDANNTTKLDSLSLIDEMPRAAPPPPLSIRAGRKQDGIVIPNTPTKPSFWSRNFL